MRRHICLLAAATLALGTLFTCTPTTTTKQKAPAVAPEPVKVKELGEDEPDGLRIRLRESEAQNRPLDRAPLAEAEKLSQADVAKVMARLQPMQGGDETKEFAFRDRSLPVPRTGETIKVTFPPPPEAAGPDASESGPLKVIRFAPEGKVPIAPQMSVTFSQPMVPVTSHATLAAKDVPVKIQPAIDGTWRWLGTKTLYFEAKERLPMATSYSVEVPAGTTSATGGKLSVAKSWKFSTPPPRVKEKVPTYGPHSTESIMWAGFDQRIDRQAVLQTIKVIAGKDKQVEIRLATAAEVEADKRLEYYLEQFALDRWIAFKSVRPLSPATKIRVHIGPGTPSSEGPRKTQKAQIWTFRTYNPLRIERHRCGWSWDACRPQFPFTIEFNNPLDAETFDEKLVTVEPSIDGMRAHVSWGVLTVQGRTKARTKYKVTVSSELRDQFRQTLGSIKTRSFQVGPARPQLNAAREGFVVLDPAAKGRYSVFSVNFKKLKVQLYAVQPDDWPKFARQMQKYRWRGGGIKIPGKRVLSKTIRVEAKPDEMVETPIDLSPALSQGYGQVIAIIEHLDPPPPHSQRRVIRSWIQVTDIGLDAFVDDNDLTAWTTRLADGSALKDTELSFVRSKATAQSDAGGLAVLALEKVKKPKREVLVARRGDDVAILPEAIDWWSNGGLWVKREQGDALRWYVFNDRGMYKPKETAHFKGWIRRIDMGEGGDVAALGKVTSSVTYKVRGARGNVVGKGSAKLNAIGGFDFEVKFPDAVNLGPATLELTAVGTKLPGKVHYHTFQIQEFRRPEFEVNVVAGDGPHFVGEHADITTTAAYFAGGGLAGAPVNWQVSSSRGSFTPPNRGDFTYGTWTPWWLVGTRYKSAKFETLQGTTDAMGKHHLRLDFEAVKPPRATSVKAQASITDVNRQVWSASQTILVHPASEYVGLRTERPFFERGKPMKVEAIVTDLEGDAISGRRIEMEAVHLRWVYEKRTWKEKEEDPQLCQVSSTPEPTSCTFKTTDGGRYRVRATVRDGHGRPNQTELTVWVTGGKLPPSRNVEQEKVTLVPDRKEYQPGDTAEILVQAPFAPAEGVLTLRRSGIVETRRFTMKTASTTLEIPLLEAHIPNVHIQVDLVGAAPRVNEQGEDDPRLPKRPAFARGAIKLDVPPLRRTLKLSVTPRHAAVEPGGETIVDIELRDAAGKPVEGGEVAVVVVDEAILALTGYKIIDPITVFYSQRPPSARDHHTRASVLLANPEGLKELAAAPPPPPEAKMKGANRSMAPMMSLATRGRGLSRKKNGGGQPHDGFAFADKDSEAEPPGAEPIRVRSDFEPLAVFAPEVPTDANGKAQVKVKLRDNLTRYRVMAVAVSGGKEFGSGEATITARLPLMIRASPPRFLNFGDTMELPIVLQNQLDEALVVDVAIRTMNLDLTDGAGRRVTVPAGGRVEVRFPAAAKMPGTARFQVGAVAGRWTDAAEHALPVWTPATTEAFATYGEIDDGAKRLPIEGPADVVPQFGGLEVTSSSTALQALTDAVLYIVAYPYECAEQLSSRILAIAALRDVLSAFEAEGLPSKKKLDAAVKRDIDRLRGMQNSDGGFGFWRSYDDSWPFVTVHATHALLRAKKKGYEVPKEMLEDAFDYLEQIERHVAGWGWEYGRREVVAYATFVLQLAGKNRPEKAHRIIKEKGLGGLTLEALGWVLPVLAKDPGSAQTVASIRRYLKNKVSETAATAQFTTSTHDGDYLTLRSRRRADAVILESLITTQPKSDLIPKLVRGLLGHRKRGRWGNTQENVFVLLALDRYFAKYEKKTPDFVARAWLGDRFAGEHAFKGRTTERFRIDIPMSHLLEGNGKHDLVIGKKGPGRLYYRVGMRYAPRDLDLKPADHGFTVFRTYESVDDPDDVRRNDDGSWRIKAGARVRVRLTMVAPARRYHVALVDPLPAGFEPMNPALKVTGDIPKDSEKEDEAKGRWWWWWRPWFEHQNMRDERVEAFTSLLWDGVHKYSYVARATTPGHFVVPPPKAEEMYHPETFGRGATAYVTVE